MAPELHRPAPDGLVPQDEPEFFQFATGLLAQRNPGEGS